VSAGAFSFTESPLPPRRERAEGSPLRSPRLPSPGVRGRAPRRVCWHAGLCWQRPSFYLGAGAF